MSGRIAVIVVNWNGFEDTQRCIASVLASSYGEVAVYVVDNGSSGDEAGALRRNWPDVSVIRLERNAGYGGAANAGIEAARRNGCWAALVLNNDATISPDALEQLKASSRTRGGRAILAPLVERADGRVWSAGGKLRWPWVAGEHIGLGAEPSAFVEPVRVSWASGCALFAPMAAFDDIGGFDERYFLYLEDLDWCLRARKRGYEIWYEPSARVTHAVTKTVNAIDPRIARYYAYRNFYIAGFRHAPWAWRAWLAGHLAVSIAKVSARNALFSAYRRDSFYNARTRALFDFVRGRTGMAPYEHRIEPPVTLAEAGT